MKNTRLLLAMIATFTLGLGGCEKAPTEAEQAAKKATEEMQTAKKDTEELQAAKKAAEEMQAEMKKQVESGQADPSKIRDKQQEVLKQLDKAAGEMSGADGQKMRAMMGVIQAMAQERTAYEDRAGKLVNSGLMSAANLATDEKIDASIAELDWLVKENQRLQTYTASTPDRLRKALSGAGAGAAEVSAVVADQSPRFPVMVEVLRGDEKIFAGMKGVLGLLKGGRGKWEGEAGSMTFKDAEFEKAINAKFAEIDAATEAQLEAEKKLIQMNQR